ncbi:L-serine ammonia-lyase, iron-sulfur-dependent, subunit alpha [[Eubacterium] hominis]|uniref:L-serine ammonia-lyase, iron-sulfur-dependent, subunit alpha n=1 Tax=[Eubacterium] hominis TaxID=2764325 RepID=UPI003A4E5206
MKSLKELYRIGPGPSSSHTLGPQRACRIFKEEHPQADHFEVELYGSLSLTGKGHLTDYIIIETMKPKPCMVFFKTGHDLKHPNTMKLIAFDHENHRLAEDIVYSIGGGAIRFEGKENSEGADVYPHHTLKDILEYCHQHDMELWEYVNKFDALDDYMDEIMQTMIETVDRGLSKSGELPGNLHLLRVAKDLKRKADLCRQAVEKEKLLLSAYAYSASEENASGNTTVTAPTLGSSGIMPALVYYYHLDLGYSKECIRNGLKIAGLLGNLIKENATISGAQGGCQAEIGAAVSMGAAMVAYFHGLRNEQIEYAAEIGIEHHLGLTCDPVGGYVMIPCIERNAVGVMRAIDAAILAKGLSGIRDHKVSFDMVVNTMNYTGKKLAIELKETSLGGLATIVPVKS